MGGGGEEFIDHLNITEFIEQFVHNCKKEKKTEKRKEVRKEGARASTNDFSASSVTGSAMVCGYFY